MCLNHMTICLGCSNRGWEGKLKYGKDIGKGKKFTKKEEETIRTYYCNVCINKWGVRELYRRLLSVNLTNMWDNYQNNPA